MSTPARWTREPDLALVPADVVDALVQHWERGWNDRDADVVVAPFAADVVFSSPFVPRIVGDPGVVEIHGRDAVHRYVLDSFERATPGITYRCDEAHVGTTTVALAYTVFHPAGERRGLDVMTVNAAGEVTDWRCNYPFGPSRTSPG